VPNDRFQRMSSLTKIADWVVRAGLAGKSEAAMLDGFCYRAVDAGLSLARATVIIDPGPGRR
jgi:adenylate cyclase